MQLSVESSFCFSPYHTKVTL